jgi:hypothetical protein
MGALDKSTLGPHEQQIMFEDLPAAQRSRVILDVSFLHKSFCIAGLPLRAPKDVEKAFSRNDDTFALTVTPLSVTIPGRGEIKPGVPFGPKARLLAMWMATEVRDKSRSSGDRWLEFGKVMEWLSSIGIKPYSRNLDATKEQLVRLSFSAFTMFSKGADGNEHFKNDVLIEGGTFGAGDLELFVDGKYGQMNWPKGLELSYRAYDRFSNHSIPVPTSRIARIAHSAMALDLFLFLCYRLPLLGPREQDLVSWRQLIAQFGNGEAPSKFKVSFENSIKNALEAYPEANVELTDEGLRMRYSEPADLRRSFYVVLPGDKPLPARSRKAKHLDGHQSPALLRPAGETPHEPAHEQIGQTVAEPVSEANGY